MCDVKTLVIVWKYVVVRTFLLRQNMVVVLYRDSHEHVKYGYPRQVAHGTGLHLPPAATSLPYLT
jgi:hypothetical protein